MSRWHKRKIPAKPPITSNAENNESKTTSGGQYGQTVGKWHTYTQSKCIEAGVMVQAWVDVQNVR